MRKIKKDSCVEKNNILITGVNGFIGSNLERYIRKKYPSWNVFGIDKKVRQTKGKFRLDITKKRKFKNLLLEIKPNYIFHLAGISSNDDFGKLLHSNVITTYIFLQSINEIKGWTPRILIPSSASEYGDVHSTEMPIKEDATLNPVSNYGFSKIIQTRLSLMYAKKGLNIVIARIFNIIGKGIPTYFSFGKFSHELAMIKKRKKEPVLYTKSLDSKRDFLDISDVCKSLLYIALLGKKGEVYNVCSGKAYIIRNLLNKLIKISGIKNLKIIEQNNLCDAIKNSYGSTLKLKKLIKRFNPAPIDKSLNDAFVYYLSRI